MTADPASASLRVLVLTPPEPDATLIRTVLGQARLTAHFCADVAELCREVDVGAGAALLAEESFPLLPCSVEVAEGSVRAQCIESRL